MKAHRRIGLLGVVLVLGLFWFSVAHLAEVQNLTIGNHTLVSQRRVDRTNFEYTYRANVVNSGARAAQGVTASLTSLSVNTVVVDGQVTFGDVPAGATVQSTDTFTIRQNRLYPFNPGDLVWQIAGTPANSAPTAHAGPDQTAFVTQTVQLDGSQSSDPDGDALTFRWSFAALPTGSGAVISGDTLVNPTFLVDRPGTYEVQLIVNDGKSDSTPDRVTISTENSPPVANAGANQTVHVTETASLDGSGSTDVDGDPLTYDWLFLEVPSQSATILQNSRTFNPSFLVDEPGNYTVQLIVNDGKVDSGPKTVVISTENSAPVADAGPDLKVHWGSRVTLDGSGSYDVDDDPLTYKWALTGKPEGSTAGLSDPTAVKPSFDTDMLGSYIGQLIVNDGRVDSASDTVVITTENAKPVADPGDPFSVHVSDPVKLDGSGSKDDDEDPLTYRWSLTTRPEGSAALLMDATSITPTFSPDVAGPYIVQLVVNDGRVDSDPATVTITAEVRMAVVPNVVGMAEGAAGTAIAAADLSLGTTIREYNDTVPFGQVISQEPGAGLSVPAGSSVNLVVSLGPAPVTVPDVGGKTQAEAEETIRAAGLAVGTIANEYSDTVPAGMVMGQNPPAGTSAAKGSTVDLTVSSGPHIVTVPNVVGLPQGEAASALAAVGLAVGTVTTQHSDIIPEGSVISQDPDAGSEVAPGSTVALVVSLGPLEMLAVPNVTGLNKAEATAALNALELVLGTLNHQNSDTVAAQVVMSQDPAAGTSLLQGSAVNLVISVGPLETWTPSFPEGIVPPIEVGVATIPAESTAFLYTGENPVQTGVQVESMVKTRAAVLRGKVLNESGSPLSGVVITILNHAEFGQTKSRDDGQFDLAVNGGGYLTVVYTKEGYLFAQRTVNVPWQDFLVVEDVTLIAKDPVVTAVDLTSSGPVQVARGSVVSDSDGERSAMVMVPQGTQAEVILPDGSTQPVSSLNIRITEYTVGEDGPKRMPAPLPPTTGYTYCVELSADEAVAKVGGKDVLLSQPVPFYVDNFLDMPMGTQVPTAYYDNDKAAWIPVKDGMVIKIKGISNGMADLDTNGDDLVDNATLLSTLSITDAERVQLASLYAPEKSLWRVLLNHFSTYDLNYGIGPPDGGTPPGQPPIPPPEPPNCTNSMVGSIIECQSQILGESLGLSGTPYALTYSSGRVPGRLAANTLEISLSGATVPAPLKRIELGVLVAGRSYSQSFSADPNQTYSFFWDGKDTYGRTLQGEQQALISIGYVYDGYYNPPPPEMRWLYMYSFGLPQVSWAPIPARQDVTLWQQQKTAVSTWDARAQGLGGWTLDVHHAYDPVRKVLSRGDGSRQSGGQTISKAIATVAGNGNFSYSGDGGPATQAALTKVHCIALGPDGSLYIADFDNHRIRRVSRDGIITTVAGNGSGGYSGDGGPATEASLLWPLGMTIGPDESLHIVAEGNRRVRRVSRDGIITTVAGNGSEGYSGDGGPATQAAFSGMHSVAIAPDGTLYIADTWNCRVRRVGPDGTVTTAAGNGAGGYSGDGGPATEAMLGWPKGVAIGPDGSIYIADWWTHRVRRVSPDGIITTVAGNGSAGYSGDGGRATEAMLAEPTNVAVGPDGSLYIADSVNARIRQVRPDGIITTVAGNGESCSFTGDGGPPTAAGLCWPFGVAIGQDDSIYIADTANWRVRRVSVPMPAFSVGDITLSSQSGLELYHFDGSGRHLHTLDTRTGAVLYSFTYDGTGLLTGVVDRSGNALTIERDAQGNPTQIVSPFGQVTTLALDGNGYLASMAAPGNLIRSFTYSDGGLLTSYTDPNGNRFQCTYDSLGRLIKDENPEGGFSALSRTELENGYKVTVTNALNETNSYSIEQYTTSEDYEAGTEVRVNTFPDGTKNRVMIRPDGGTTVMYADTSRTTTEEGPDPRFGMQAPVVTSLSRRDGGQGSVVYAGIVKSYTRSAVLANPLDPLSLLSLTDTVTLSGDRTSTAVYEAATRTTTRTSAVGRSSMTGLDEKGRVILNWVDGLADIWSAYDEKGRLSTISQGSGADERKTTFTYNGEGYLQTVTDPLGRILNYGYDAAGRVILEVLPDSREVRYTYDANGNLTSLTPPGRPAHVFQYTKTDQPSEYAPPDVGAGTNSTLYQYDLAKRLTRITRPDGQAIDFVYNSGGQLVEQKMPHDTLTFSYNSTSGKLQTVSDASGENGVTFTYSGSFLWKVQDWWSLMPSSAESLVSFGYRIDFGDNRVTDVTYAGDRVIYSYDADGLWTQVGSLTLNRSAQNGLLTGSSLGVVTDALSYTSFGEVAGYEAKANGVSLFKTDNTRDKLGRIVTKVVTQGATADTYGYNYDQAGRLTEVKLNDAVVSTYSYDANGNRLSHTQGTSTTNGSYDDQDRLISYGDATYTYAANGELASKTVGTAITTFQYDVLGNLRQVVLPDGRTVDYVIDVLNRRVGKKVNGLPVQYFLYQDQLKPIAEVADNGTLVSRFVYATHANVPDYLVKSGNTNRIITDHLGSPVMVVNTSTGEIVQQMSYDEFGNVLEDTNPGFQPFGFAGGLYDRDTGLVRFGARDYDPVIGRWTAKDPIAFEIGDMNLYGYVLNNPTNLIDPLGDEPKNPDCWGYPSTSSLVLPEWWPQPDQPGHTTTIVGPPVVNPRGENCVGWDINNDVSGRQQRRSYCGSLSRDVEAAGGEEYVAKSKKRRCSKYGMGGTRA